MRRGLCLSESPLPSQLPYFVSNIFMLLLQRLMKRKKQIEAKCVCLCVHERKREKESDRARERTIVHTHPQT